MSIEIQHLSKTFFPGTSREHKALKTSAYRFKKGLHYDCRRKWCWEIDFPKRDCR